LPNLAESDLVFSFAAVGVIPFAGYIGGLNPSRILPHVGGLLNATGKCEADHYDWAIREGLIDLALDYRLHFGKFTFGFRYGHVFRRIA
jgi:hypothetical protein